MKFIACWLAVLIMPALSFGQVWKNGNGYKETPFYKMPGSITLHLTNTMFAPRKVATPPLNFIMQVTAIKNFTVGPMFTYFQFKRSEYEAINSTRWVNPEIRYHEMMCGVKAEYHINALWEKIFNRKIPQYFIDTYAAGWAGYSFVKAANPEAEESLVSDNQKFRGGVSVGARTLVLKWMGFSIEGGYSSYGYASFGLFFVAR